MTGCCSTCGDLLELTSNGMIPVHYPVGGGDRCAGSRQAPKAGW